jgi:hypothetical protein
MNKIFLSGMLLFGAMQVPESLVQDEMTQQDAQKWYAVHKGCYLYVRDFGAKGCNNLEQVFDKMRLVRDTCLPSKDDSNFNDAINEVFEKYEERTLSDETLSDLADDLYKISEDIKKYHDGI